MPTLPPRLKRLVIRTMHTHKKKKRKWTDLVELEYSWLDLPKNHSLPWICFQNILQALLAIFDSPLTKAGSLQAVYVRTEKGVLFEIKPHVRMPRTFKLFCGLMCKILINLYTLWSLCVCFISVVLMCGQLFNIAAQLLQKLSITAVGKREKLLNVVKNPVTHYLPVGARKIGESLYCLSKHVSL